MSAIYTIIVTYNAMKWIDKCIDCLHKSSLHTEIVVVDNCSKDDTVSHLSTKYPDVHLILNEKNRGFGQANNQGIEYAYKEGANHFFLCNQDLYVVPETIEKLVEVQIKYGLYVASPLQMNGTYELFDQSFYRDFVRDNNQFVADLVNSLPKEYYEVKFTPAAAWMISRESINYIGGFDPLFFHYGEDANYLDRVRYHSGIIGVVPSSMVAHDRVFKGNANAFNKYSRISSLLYLHSNPSLNVLTLNKSRIVVHLVFIRDIFKSLLRFKFKEFYYLSFSYLSFWTKIWKIAQSIKSNRCVRANWLNLEDV